MSSKYDKVVRSDPRSPRYYKACDVARIARNCVQDTGVPAEVLIACVAKELEFEKIWVADKDRALNRQAPKYKSMDFLSMVDQLANDYGAYMAAVAVPAEWGLPEEIAAAIRALLKRAATVSGRFFGIIGSALIIILMLIMELYKSIEQSIAISASDVLDSNGDWCNCKRKGKQEPDTQRKVTRGRGTNG